MQPVVELDEKRQIGFRFRTKDLTFAFRLKPFTFHLPYPHIVLETEVEVDGGLERVCTVSG